MPGWLYLVTGGFLVVPVPRDGSGPASWCVRAGVVRDGGRAGVPELKDTRLGMKFTRSFYGNIAREFVL